MIFLSSIQDQLKQVLHIQEPPHRIALAFALGVFIAFSPTYGLHTLSAIFLAWALRLNYTAVILGNFVNNPWTIVPILGAAMWTGFFVLGIPNKPTFSWNDLSGDAILGLLMPYIIPFALGSCILGLLGSLVAYPLGLIVISRYKKRYQVSTETAGCSKKPT